MVLEVIIFWLHITLSIIRVNPTLYKTILAITIKSMKRKIFTILISIIHQPVLQIILLENKLRCYMQIFIIQKLKMVLILYHIV